MSTFGWDLPPGVSTNDIPGNRPQDIAEEHFWDALISRVEAKGLDIPGGETCDGQVYWYENPAICALIDIVREMVFNEAYEQGRAEGQMEEMDRQEAKGRRKDA
jgi:hypothetical protein